LTSLYRLETLKEQITPAHVVAAIAEHNKMDGIYKQETTTGEEIGEALMVKFFSLLVAKRKQLNKGYIEGEVIDVQRQAEAEGSEQGSQEEE